MKGTILSIEDNEQNQYLVTFLLEKNGYKVLCAPDGDTGIRMAVAAPPDLILLDIQLPGRDGYGVAAALREISILDTIPIVAVTSFAMSGDREKAMAAGCTGYLEKPIDPDTFVAALETYRKL